MWPRHQPLAWLEFRSTAFSLPRLSLIGLLLPAALHHCGARIVAMELVTASLIAIDFPHTHVKSPCVAVVSADSHEVNVLCHSGADWGRTNISFGRRNASYLYSTTLCWRSIAACHRFKALSVGAVMKTNTLFCIYTNSIRLVPQALLFSGTLSSRQS